MSVKKKIGRKETSLVSGEKKNRQKGRESTVSSWNSKTKSSTEKKKPQGDKRQRKESGKRKNKKGSPPNVKER